MMVVTIFQLRVMAIPVNRPVVATSPSGLSLSDRSLSGRLRQGYANAEGSGDVKATPDDAQAAQAAISQAEAYVSYVLCCVVLCCVELCCVVCVSVCVCVCVCVCVRARA